MGAIFAPTRFSLVRISIRDLGADGKSLLRNSGVGGGGQNRILTLGEPHAWSTKTFKGPSTKRGVRSRSAGSAMLEEL